MLNTRLAFPPPRTYNSHFLKDKAYFQYLPSPKQTSVLQFDSSWNDSHQIELKFFFLFLFPFFLFSLFLFLWGWAGKFCPLLLQRDSLFLHSCTLIASCFEHKISHYIQASYISSLINKASSWLVTQILNTA